MVLAYDLLEDRRTIDVIIIKFFPLFFRFENLDNSLRDWAKEKTSKSLDNTLKRYEKLEEEKYGFFVRKWLRKNTRAVSVGSRARSNQKQIGLQINSKERNYCFVWNITNPINKIRGGSRGRVQGVRTPLLR